VLQKLRRLLPYRELTAHQLRRLMERALRDPRAEELLRVDITPPTDPALREAMLEALPDLQEVVVIPSVELLDPSAAPIYLGIIAAKTFEGRFVGGQGIGLGYGQAIHAFTTTLNLPAVVRANLRFYALTNSSDPQICGLGAENLLQLIATYWAAGEPVSGFIAPKQLTPEQLHWAFLEIGTLEPEDLLGRWVASCGNPDKSQLRLAAAEVLGQLLRADGQFLSRLNTPLESVPLALLRQMVRMGRNVVGIAGGTKRASAVLAAVRAGVINRLVTDDRCAVTILHLVNPRFRSADLPSRSEWWESCQRFFIAHLRYRQTPRQNVQAIAKQLHLSTKAVRRILGEMKQGRGPYPSIVRTVVRPPSEAMALELALLETMGLCEARVVTVAEGESGLAKVGEAAAEVFFELARNKMTFTVGFGGGRTVNAMVNALKLPASLSRLPHLKSLNIWALDSNPLPKVLGLAAHTLIAAIAARCLQRSDRIVRCFAYQSDEGTPDLDAVFIGIGIFAPGETLSLYAQEVGLPVKGLATKVAGSTLFQGISPEGSIVPLGFEGRVQALPLSRLQRLVAEGRPVVIIASGAHKAPAILAAHRAGLFNGLVVDRELAIALLSFWWQRSAVKG